MHALVHRLLLSMLLSCATAAYAADVLTYHSDNLRTGWNGAETALTPTSVASSNFGLLNQTQLDGQVDAAPIVVTNQAIAGAGTHDVAYVVTSRNHVYAIDANAGGVLAQTSVGTPVPGRALPEHCHNNDSTVGITSTPVFDPSTNTLYLIAYTSESGTSTYRIHALDGTTLADKVSPPVIAATWPSAQTPTFTFTAAVQRQRSALLLSNGTVYAGFGSFCDGANDISRGWVFGWSASTLQMIPSVELTNRDLTSFKNQFLTSVWMSGAGLAADASGNVFFVTGNSDNHGTSYNHITNPSETVLKLAPDLSKTITYFTPRDPNVGVNFLDARDLDFGAGGIMLLPDQPGGTPHLAIAAGKIGPMYLLGRDHLGGLEPPASTFGTYVNDGCWCTPSYFTGADGVGRVVESTGSLVRVWTVVTGTKPALTLESTSPSLPTGQDPGFFTAVSSNGVLPNTAVIWAVTRPVDKNPAILTLQAFDPAQGAALLFSGAAGTWPNAGSANANIVPVTANGHVYVASYYNLSIFGLSNTGQHTALRAVPSPAPNSLSPTTHVFHGVVTAVAGPHFSLRLRSGVVLQVQVAAGETEIPAIGQATAIIGSTAADGSFLAADAYRIKAQPGTWDQDH